MVQNRTGKAVTGSAMYFGCRSTKKAAVLIGTPFTEPCKAAALVVKKRESFTIRQHKVAALQNSHQTSWLSMIAMRTRHGRFNDIYRLHRVIDACPPVQFSY